MHNLLLSIFLMINIFNNILVLADPPYWNCPDANSSNNSTSESFFLQNVDSLLFSISSNASVSKFYNMSAGNDSITSYGLYLCYDYVTLETCRTSMIMATQAIRRLCPNSTDATVWGEQSLLRVSNQRFFGHLDMTGNINKYNKKYVSEPEKFRTVVNTSLHDLALKAAYNTSLDHMYATQSTSFSGAQHVYSLVQCTLDLSPIDCQRCLHKGIVDVLGSQNYKFRGGRLLSKSCYLRYEFYAFFEGETSEDPAVQGKKWTTRILSIGLACVLVVLIGSCLFYIVLRRKNQATNFRGMDSPLFDLASIQAATENFSEKHKLGEGGFGPVFKGVLKDGTKVAVKRLSNTSDQGTEEFKNEVLLIMKLQHKNLVRLLGFCVDGAERLLIYELLPSGDLDSWLYDSVLSADHLSTSCPANEIGNYTANSRFELNLRTLLGSLPLNTSISGFYNGSAGSDPNKVYALALCRGDVSASDCELCVRQASLEIFRQCKAMEATIWLDLCQIRYSYYMFFSSMTYGGKYENENHTVNPAVSSKVLSRLMHELSFEAASNFSSQMFAVGHTKVSDYTIYGLVQCTRDISPYDCSNCLISAFGDLDGCCSLHQGGSILSFSCSMRFEAYRFYNATAVNDIFVPSESRSRTWVLIVAIGVPTLLVIVIAGFFAVYYWMKVHKGNDMNQSEIMSAVTIPKDVVITEEGNLVSTEGLTSMDLATLKDATDNFSDSKLLGQGGFGAVYEGRLPDGTKLAVKRLARRTWQGGEELKNEIILMANLQHRNLVRLLGCGIEGQEKILVYEPLPNKSLDLYIYDTEKRVDLNWETRFNIINGIARGLRYLHDGARIRIIHRDLKPSNVLLDQDMNAKISDFGIARIFCVDQNIANTKRVVGTYGYMAPEYAMEGLFSVKSDVFSFGVIVLEIISGIRSSRYFKEHSKSLVSYAWKLWNEGRELEFVDSLLAMPCSMEEVLRCLHIALLCLQEDPTERPAMATVVSLLSGESLTLPQPNVLSISVRHDADQMIAASDSSVNDLTTSTVVPR